MSPYIFLDFNFSLPVFGFVLLLLRIELFNVYG